MPNSSPSLAFTPQSLIDVVRKFLRDNPKLNELRGVMESDDDDIRLAINMAISDWNMTPPLLAPVGLNNFPIPNWLILATVVFVLQSAGILQYRNELPYNDSGISVNPWSKGPNYFKTAMQWAQFVEQQKREYKYAINIANTFGVVRSPEYLVWDWAGLYTGPQFDNRGATYQALAGTGAGTPSLTETKPSSTAPFNFSIDLWEADNANGVFYLIFNHGLLSEVDVRITNPDTGMDIKSQMKTIQFVSNAVVKLTVNMIPDGRLAGRMIAYKI